MILPGLVAAGLLSWAGIVKAGDLSLQYKKWLEEDAAYIIGPKEKEVFMRLATDRQRDLFIEAFWKQRDPVPASEKNEFREEHYRRMAYANEHFGRSSTLPGWKTERGRVYIILGPPQQTFRYDQSREIVPVEVWFYQGLARFGLPDAFSCVFYKPNPAGDYELYSPVGDGPAKLMRGLVFDPADTAAAYARLRELEPDVARVSLSLLEGEQQSALGPSLASEALLSGIAQVPLKMIKEEYAEKFFRFKEIVEVEYSANYIDNRSLLAVIRDPSGLSFIHYAVELSRLSVEFEAGRYRTTLELNGKAADKQGRLIFQFERKAPVSLDKDQVESLRSRPFSLQGLFPLAEGDYDLTLIVKNAASKEFTTVEESVHVPSPARGLALGPLLMAYGARKEAGPGPKGLRAFALPGLQLFVSPLSEFLPGEKLTAAFGLFGPPSEIEAVKSVRYDILDAQSRVKTTRTALLAAGGGSGFVQETFDLDGLPPADYTLDVALLDGSGRALQSGRAAFGLTSARYVPRPLISSETMAEASNPVYAYVLGGQYLNKAELSRALAFSGDAHSREPASQKYALGYARVLLALGKYAEIKAALEPFLRSGKPEAETLEYMARAYQALADYAGAVKAYSDYLSRFGAKLSVLNDLGECYLKLGDTGNARLAWERSLALKPDQDDVRKAVSGIKK